MKTRILGAVTVAILVLADGVIWSALAFNEPDGFRGVPWGTSEDALREKLGERSDHGVLWTGCDSYRPEEPWMGDRFCSGAFPLGDITVKAVYAFRANRFVRVTLIFPSRDFGRLAAIFVERYGPPTHSTQEPYKTQGGLQAVNETHR